MNDIKQIINEDKSILLEVHKLNGNLHREDGPAVIAKSIDSNKFGIAVGGEYWYRDNLLHREDGAAVIHYHRDGSTTEQYFINGVEYADSTFTKKVATSVIPNNIARHQDNDEPHCG